MQATAHDLHAPDTYIKGVLSAPRVERPLDGSSMMALVLHPVLSAFLLGLWLLLNQSLSPGHVLLGSLIAVAGGLCDLDA